MQLLKKSPKPSCMFVLAAALALPALLLTWLVIS